jgi:hypothetical protein
MKRSLQYISDSSGKRTSVQVPLAAWKRLMTKLEKYEQALNLKTDLQEALLEVARLRKSKSKKQTLNEFLNEL